MVRRWDRFDDAWDREYAMRGRLWRGSADASFLVDRSPADSWVLEVGCGDGKFLRGLAAVGRGCVGLDRSSHALRIARRGFDGPLVRADARRLPFPDGFVPVVTARYLLGALAATDRAAAASELWRVAAPGGLVLVEEFGSEDFRNGSGTKVEPGTFERNHGILTHYWERPEVESLMPATPSEIEERRWRQRTRDGPVDRQAWKVVWRRAGVLGLSRNRIESQ